MSETSYLILTRADEDAISVFVVYRSKTQLQSVDINHVHSRLGMGQTQCDNYNKEKSNVCTCLCVVLTWFNIIYLIRESWIVL